MQKRLIPNTNLRASVVCMGTGELGSSVSQDDSFRLLDAMMEGGGNYIDTAKDYGDWVAGIERSASEKVIGRWIESRGVRKEVVIQTKGCMPDALSTPEDTCSPATIRRHIESSLQSLRVDSIDIWFVHRDQPLQPMEEMLETIHEMQRKGYIRHYAFSNTSLERIREARRICTEKGYEEPVGVQGLWNAAVLQCYPYGDAQVAYMDEERFQYHTEQGLPWFAFQSTAFGLFHRMANGSLEMMNQGFRGFYNEAKSKDRFMQMQRIAKQRGVSLSAVILAYVYGNPYFPAYAIVGSHKLNQVIDNFSCGDFMLTAEEFEAINAGHGFEAF